MLSMFRGIISLKAQKRKIDKCVGPAIIAGEMIDRSRRCRRDKGPVCGGGPPKKDGGRAWKIVKKRECQELEDEVSDECASGIAKNLSLGELGRSEEKGGLFGHSGRSR
jgi:hypothetical protein